MPVCVLQRQAGLARPAQAAQRYQPRPIRADPGQPDIQTREQPAWPPERPPAMFELFDLSL